ncbi:MAG: YtxH domain-containing protein [Deltaproteobacteria bacterium]|nr:YtxH domain-containing protein [Deltaproteobacteria bacterium]
MGTNRGNALFAFLLGGAIGAGIALLYAPGKGVDTRRRIKDGLEDAGDWAKDRYQDTKYRVSEGTGKVKQIITDKKDDIQAAYEAGREAYYKGKERLTKEAL